MQINDENVRPRNVKIVPTPLETPTFDGAELVAAGQELEAGNSLGQVDNAEDVAMKRVQAPARRHTLQLLHESTGVFLFRLSTRKYFGFRPQLCISCIC